MSHPQQKDHKEKGDETATSNKIGQQQQQKEEKEQQQPFVFPVKNVYFPDKCCFWKASTTDKKSNKEEETKKEITITETTTTSTMDSKTTVGSKTTTIPKQKEIQKLCRSCFNPCHKEKHYHAPTGAPRSGDSWIHFLDYSVVYCSPHCILARQKNKRSCPQGLFHKWLHEMMITHHKCPSWVFPATPTWLCSSVIDSFVGVGEEDIEAECYGKHALDIHEHLAQGHMVQLLKEPHYIPQGPTITMANK